MFKVVDGSHSTMANEFHGFGHFVFMVMVTFMLMVLFMGHGYGYTYVYGYGYGDTYVYGYGIALLRKSYLMDAYKSRRDLCKLQWYFPSSLRACGKERTH